MRTEMWSDIHDGFWSHGDGAMGNVLYDADSGRALLIDFEIVHRQDLSAVTRQADDLHAFLMDLVSLSSSRRWLAMALAFLRTYDRVDVITEFRRGLFVPKGAAWIWWKIRVNFVPEGKVADRLARLAKAMDQGVVGCRRQGRHRRALFSRAKPEVMAGEPLPRDYAGDAEGEFADAAHERQCQRAGGRDAQQLADSQVAAFLKTECTGDEEDCRADSLGHTLKGIGDAVAARDIQALSRGPAAR